MTTKNNECRRSFIRKCAAITAGATVLGSGIKVSATPQSDWASRGYCTARCDTSCTWFASNQCPGCKALPNNVCTLKDCGSSRSVEICAQCDELTTCNNEFWDSNPERKTEMIELRNELGLSGISNHPTEKQRITINPNPARDKLSVQNPNNITAVYQLVNQNGQICKKGNLDASELNLNISDLKSGNYILRLVRNNNTLQTHQVIKL